MIIHRLKSGKAFCASSQTTGFFGRTASLTQHFHCYPRPLGRPLFAIGTSVGAVLGTLLAAGVSVEDLLACQQGTGQCEWDHDKDTGGKFPPMPTIGLTGFGLVKKALRKEVPLMTAISGLAPKGGFDMTPFRRSIDSVVKRGNWVDHPALWLVTVNTSTGERTAFGHPHAPMAAANDAVCASYGVPGWCPPIKIGEHEYMDGGVASPTSADLLLDTDVDEVVILAPMTSSQADNPISLPARLERTFRRHMTGILDKEVSALQQAGKRVMRVEPDKDDLKAIGYNMMDPARRLQVLNTALNNINRPMNWI